MSIYTNSNTHSYAEDYEYADYQRESKLVKCGAEYNDSLVDDCIVQALAVGLEEIVVDDEIGSVSETPWVVE